MTSREVRGTSGKSGKLPENLWIAGKFHSERTVEVARELTGKFGELPGKSGNFAEARGSLTPFQQLAKFVSKIMRCITFTRAPTPQNKWHYSYIQKFLARIIYAMHKKSTLVGKPQGCSQSEFQLTNFFSCTEECGEVFGEKMLSYVSSGILSEEFPTKIHHFSLSKCPNFITLNFWDRSRVVH